MAYRRGWEQPGEPPLPDLSCCRSNCAAAQSIRGAAHCDTLIRSYCAQTANRYTDECACLRRPPHDALSNLSHCVDAACRRPAAMKLSYMKRVPCPTAVDCVQRVFVVGTGDDAEKPATLAGLTTEQVCQDTSADHPSVQRGPAPAQPQPQPGQLPSPSAPPLPTGPSSGPVRAWHSLLGWTVTDGVVAAACVVLALVVALATGGLKGAAAGMVLGGIGFAVYWGFIAERIAVK